MTTADLTATDLKGHLAETTERASRGERIRVLRHGRALCAVVPASDLDLLERIERLSDLRAADRVRKAGAKPIDAEDLFRELGL